MKEAEMMRVRLPPEVRIWVADRAKRDAGSMNSVIVRTLKRQMEREAEPEGRAA